MSDKITYEEAERVVKQAEPISMTVEADKVWTRRMAVAMADLFNARIATKDAEIERLREALEFYSCDETNCECDTLGENRNTLSCGYVARAALSPIPDPAGGMPVEVET